MTDLAVCDATKKLQHFPAQEAAGPTLADIVGPTIYPYTFNALIDTEDKAKRVVTLVKALLADEAANIEEFKGIHIANTLDAETEGATLVYEKWMRVLGFAADPFWC